MFPVIMSLIFLQTQAMIIAKISAIAQERTIMSSRRQKENTH
jgi:hypothetical protein